MVTNRVLKRSPHGNFKVTQLCKSVVICEAPSDPHGWGNATEDEPAFMVYLGCQKHEVKKYVRTFNHLYDCEWCEVRKPKYLKGFEAEIKVRGMQRSDLERLVEDQIFEAREWYAELTTLETDEEGIPTERRVALEATSKEDALEGLKLHLGDDFKKYQLIGIFPVGKDEEF